MTNTGLVKLPSIDGAARPMIVADNAHVTYKVYAGGKPVGARSKLLGQRGGVINSVHALRGVSFTANQGETIGVVGHNGSGKSTLFRAMAGLIPTTEGHIWAADRPVLLGVNAALMPELSGESNIKLGLLAMGFTSEEAAAHVDEIADFAELNEFISHPMRTYSSGMGARLRFAIASARAHSILLLDEALAVGDRRFRLKSEERIRSLRDAAGLVMIVSHSAGSLRDTCERGLWIHKGELRADGDINDVVSEYTKWTKDPTSVAVGAASKPKTQAAVKPSAPATAPMTALIPTDTGLTPRAAARRERFLADTRRKSRRRALAIGLTGAALIIAVGAGAAVALLTRQSDRIELNELRTAASSSPSHSPTPTPVALPVINSFTAPPTAYCETIDATVDVALGWDIADATAVTVTATGLDGATVPILEAQPASVPSQPVAFQCNNESMTYTLVAANEIGEQVTATVVVARELAPVPEVPVETEEPPVEATDPPVEATDPPVEPTDPPVEPTDPVDPTDPPTEEPTPDPTSEADPPIEIPVPEVP